MKEIYHCAIDIAADCNYEWILDNLLNGKLLPETLQLQNATGSLFSNITIDKMIAEELIHDKVEIHTSTNWGLNSMSSGEQKKALLQYLILKNPGFIIVDNVLDNLDRNAQKSILSTLQSMAVHVLIIQVVNRKNDILPFISKVYSFKNNLIKKEQSLNDYLNAPGCIENNFVENKIPSGLSVYTLIGRPLVSLKNISVSYNNRQILDKINWEINPGEFWQLVGPNGSGKSTLLSLITGDNAKGYGQDLFLFGRKKGSGETVWDIKQNIGYVTPTLTQLFTRMDSVENMVISGFYDSVGLYIIPNETQVKTARHWLHVIGLYEQKDKPYSLLTLGKQRLVLLARAMIKHPPLLILDEPTCNLDDNSVLLFTALVNKIADESNTAIIYVSHRNEKGLQPQHIFELTPGKNGSVGCKKSGLIS